MPRFKKRQILWLAIRGNGIDYAWRISIEDNNRAVFPTNLGYFRRMVMSRSCAMLLDYVGWSQRGTSVLSCCVGYECEVNAWESGYMVVGLNDQYSRALRIILFFSFLVYHTTYLWLSRLCSSMHRAHSVFAIDDPTDLVSWPIGFSSSSFSTPQAHLPPAMPNCP